MRQFWVLGMILILWMVMVTGCSTVLAPAPEVNIDVTVIDEVIERGDPDGLHVVATTSMVADLVAVIGGDHVRVSQIIGINIDPRSAALDDERTALLSEAELVFYNGLGLEAAMLDALAAADGISLGDSLVGRGSEALPTIITDPDGTPDPHIWHDVRVWIQAGEFVRDALIDADSENADDYNANYDAYFEELRLLDEEIEGQIGAVPNTHRLIFAPESALRYYQRGYGIITETVTPENVERLAGEAVRLRLPAVFPLTTGDNALIGQLAQRAARDSYSPRIAAPLYAYSLAAPGEYGDTYVDMMRYNTSQISAALTGAEVE